MANYKHNLIILCNNNHHGMFEIKTEYRMGRGNLFPAIKVKIIKIKYYYSR